VIFSPKDGFMDPLRREIQPYYSRCTSEGFQWSFSNYFLIFPRQHFPDLSQWCTSLPTNPRSVPVLPRFYEDPISDILWHFKPTHYTYSLYWTSRLHVLRSSLLHCTHKRLTTVVSSLRRLWNFVSPTLLDLYYNINIPAVFRLSAVLLSNSRFVVYA